MSKYLLLTTTVMLLSSLRIRADAVYTYTGIPFADYSDPFEQGDYVHGSFVVTAPLAANLVNDQISPTSFNFSAFPGGYPFVDQTNATVEDFQIWTDSHGAIKFWYLFLNAGPYQTLYSWSINTQYGPIDTGHDSATVGSSDSFGNGPGTWTSNVTPEPSALVLVITGLFALLLVARHRRA